MVQNQCNESYSSHPWNHRSDSGIQNRIRGSLQDKKSLYGDQRLYQTDQKSDKKKRNQETGQFTSEDGRALSERRSGSQKCGGKCLCLFFGQSYVFLQTIL